MTGKDAHAFAETLKTLAETLDAPVSEGRAEMYFHVLEAFSIEEIREAIRRGLAQWRFFPKPAEILDILAPPVDLELQGAAAFEVALEHNFYDRNYRFQDPGIHRATELMGGWAAYCQNSKSMPERDWGFYRREWIKTYAAAYRSGDIESARPAIGIAVACPYLETTTARRITG